MPLEMAIDECVLLGRESVTVFPAEVWSTASTSRVGLLGAATSMRRRERAPWDRTLDALEIPLRLSGEILPPIEIREEVSI